VSHASRDANLLGACALAVSGRLSTGAADTALVALHGWLEGTTIDGLARVLGLTHSGAVRLVDRLERDGLVARRSGADGRSVALHLTARGHEAGEALRLGREQALLGVLAPLGAAERTALSATLEKLLGAITAGGASPRRTCRLCDADACGHPDHCPVTRAAHP
jgi:DNA-binding MarR family transcriptional regulator